MRAGENTDSSTSSTSSSSAAPTFSYSSTTRSQMAYMTPIGPCSSTWARSSRSRRESARSMPSPWRTVTTKSRADEHVDLAGLDRVLLVDVPERLEHEEQRVAVVLELGPLVGVAGVLDGQRVQVEGARDQLELVGAGVVDADPLEVARVARHPRVPEALVVAVAQRHPLAPVVEGVVHDHRPRLVPLASGECPPSSSSDTAARRPTPPESSPAGCPASTSTTPG